MAIRVPEIRNMSVRKEDDGTYFKGVYCWCGVDEPNLPEINSSNGKITDWKA